MRTTFTLDDDVAKLVGLEIRRTGESHKATVNRLLRLGLNASAKPEMEKPFVIKPVPLGAGELLDRHHGKVSALIEALEGSYHR